MNVVTASAKTASASSSRIGRIMRTATRLAIAPRAVHTRRPTARLHRLRRRAARDRAAARAAVLPAHARAARRARWPSAATGSSRSTCSATAIRTARCEKWRYSMPEFAREVVALLDHLGVPDAVVLGTSLGANVTLEVADSAPERLRGMVIEMPVLDNALLGCALAFTPLMVALTVGEPAMRALSPAPRGRSRAGGCRGRPTSCSTGSARTRRRAPPCCRACSSAAPRRRARGGARCRRRRS